jgi:3',5'-cyclic AMP phosphodiesterase CpdA
MDRGWAIIPLVAISFVHLSDLHLEADPHAWNDHDGDLNHAGARFEVLARFIDTEHPDAHVVITGDVTDSGTPAQYREALRLLGPWMRRGILSVVPGNHDCGTWGLPFVKDRWQMFYRAFSSAIGASAAVPWVKYLGPVALIGVDTTLASEGTGFACGAVGEQQLDRLGAVLSNPAVKGRMPVVLMHHHPFDRNSTTLLADAAQFRLALRRGQQYRRKALVLYGHRHGSDRHPQGCVTYVEAPSSIVPQGEDRRLVFRLVRIDANGRINIRSRRVPLPSGLA